jgi:hypothetical protein
LSTTKFHNFLRSIFYFGSFIIRGRLENSKNKDKNDF